MANLFCHKNTQIWAVLNTEFTMHIHNENAHRIKFNHLAPNSQIQGIKCQWILILQLYRPSLKGFANTCI